MAEMNGTQTPTAPAPDAAKTAEIDAARPAWAKPKAPAAPVNGAGKTPPPAPVNGKDVLSAVVEKVEGKTPPAPVAKDPNNPEGGEQPPADPQKRKYEVTVRGKKVIAELTDDEARAWVQKGLGADSKFEEASAMYKKAQQVFEAFKDKGNIERALQMLGYENPRGVLEEILLEHIKLESMTPEQREAHENREKLKSFEQEKIDRENQAKELRHQQLTEHFSGEYQKAIIKAIPSSGLPVNEETIGRVAFYMNAALTQLGKEMTPEQVIPLVREDYQNSLRRFISASDASVISELLGEDGLKKIREFELSRLNGNKGRIPNAPPSKGLSRGDDAPPVPAAKKGMTIEEFRERNERIKRGE